ncbi:hypothetical protein D3C72_1006000 [compost metagenome]
MDIVTNIVILLHGKQYLISNIFRMRGTEAYPQFRRYECHQLQQVGKVHYLRAIIIGMIVAIYILSQQGYFFIPSVYQVLHFAQDRLRVTAALTATGEWYYAESTHVITATHNAHK